MNEPQASRTVTLANRHGWHIRPVTLVAKLAGQFKAKVEVVKDRQRANARSVLEMLSLGARQGDQFQLEAWGEDAEAALAALADLFAARFHEDDA